MSDKRLQRSNWLGCGHELSAGTRARPFHTMPPKDPIVLFCNASKHSLLCQLFTPIVLY